MPLPVWDQWIGDSITAMVLYVFIYVGFGAAIGRWGQAITPEFRPAHARVLTLLLVPLTMIAPYVPGMFGYRYRVRSDSFIWVMNPFKALEQILYSTRGWSNSSPEKAQVYVFILSAAAAIVLIVNLRALFAGVSEVLEWQSAPDTESAVSDVEGANAAVPG
jgi:hypothetical protein